MKSRILRNRIHGLFIEDLASSPSPFLVCEDFKFGERGQKLHFICVLMKLDLRVLPVSYIFTTFYFILGQGVAKLLRLDLKL